MKLKKLKLGLSVLMLLFGLFGLLGCDKKNSESTPALKEPSEMTKEEIKEILINTDWELAEWTSFNVRGIIGKDPKFQDAVNSLISFSSTVLGREITENTYEGTYIEFLTKIKDLYYNKVRKGEPSGLGLIAYKESVNNVDFLFDDSDIFNQYKIFNHIELYKGGFFKYLYELNDTNTNYKIEIKSYDNIYMEFSFIGLLDIPATNLTSGFFINGDSFKMGIENNKYFLLYETESRYNKIIQK